MRCIFFSRTLVVLRLVLIGSKDLDGGETSDAILAPQRLVLVCIYCADLHDTLEGFRNKNSSWESSLDF